MAAENGTPVGSKVLQTKKPSLASKLSSLAQAIYASITPPAKYPYTPSNVDNTPQTGLLEDIQKLGFDDYSTLLAFLNASVTGVTDDKDLLLERLVRLLSKLPAHSKEMKELTDGFINQLWTDLDHPPASSLGGQYKYREADGSFNNIHAPSLGAANTPYARTVQPLVFQNPDLPDPSAIFDSLMARGDHFEPHPNGISSMLFYLATIIIHDIFQTSPDDYNVNLTSSYLDLAPLYGRNSEELKAMRTFKDGLLKPDCFSSKRILGFPPGCSVFLIMFNRFHNYVVTQLAIINESGRFNKPSSNLKDKAAEEAWAKYDNDLFQTGRLITCGLYANIILKDYVRTILSLNRSGATWSLDPRTHEGKNIFSKGSPEGVGNQVSAEFNLIYRWHSAISRRDEQWTIDEFKRIMPDKDPATASMVDVLKALRSFEADLSDNPGQRALSGLQRLADGTFDDDDLVKILRESIEDVAGSFGGNRVPNCLKTIEVLGILQARYWNVATLNEFRSFMGLTKYKTFEDINPNPDIAKKLGQLYDSPDSVELYPGLVAEKPKPPMTPGSGLCVNYTTSRAILSDAVALVRGDRFYTIDYTPKNITNWGYNEANYDISVNQGHVMHKLIFRAFPKHFAQNSIYAHFPFVVPSENTKILDALGTSSQYTWEAPKRQGELVIIKSHKAITAILNNKKDFKVTWGPAIEFLTNSESGQVMAKDFCLAHDETANMKNRQYIIKALYPGSNWHQDIANFYAMTANRLLEQYSYEFKAKTVRVREVDIVRDVIALANTHFMSALFDLPIKTDVNPHGIYSEQQMYMVLVATFSCIFFDADIASSFKLHSAARELAQQLGSLVSLNAKVIAKGGLIEGLIDTFKAAINGVHVNGNADLKWPSLKSFGDQMIERMLAGGKNVDEVVWGSIMPLTAAGVANQTQNLSQAVEYYLGDGKEHLPELYRLSHDGSKDSDEKLMKYMLEGCRLRATVAVYRDLASEQTITDYSPSLPNPNDPKQLNPVPNPDPSRSSQTFRLPAGTRIVLDLIAAGHDAAAFPEPEKVRLDRPIDSYMHFGWGPHECLGKQASQVGLTALFKSIMGLKNLRRGDGPQGEIKSFPIAPWNGQIGDRNVDPGWTGLRTYMTADQSGYWPLPSTLKVRWDA